MDHVHKLVDKSLGTGSRVHRGLGPSHSRERLRPQKLTAVALEWRGSRGHPHCGKKVAEE
jgi:hypothetical protein